MLSRAPWRIGGPRASGVDGRRLQITPRRTLRGTCPARTATLTRAAKVPQLAARGRRDNRYVAADGYASVMGNQIDFAGMLIAAMVALPGQLIGAYLANPGPWNLVGLMMAGVIALKLIGG